MSNLKNKQNLANFLSHSLSVLCKRELQPHQQVVYAGGFTDSREAFFSVVDIT